MADKDRRNRHVQSELTNGLPNRVVIGEMIGKDLKAADTPERLRAAAMVALRRTERARPSLSATRAFGRKCSLMAVAESRDQRPVSENP